MIVAMQQALAQKLKDIYAMPRDSNIHLVKYYSTTYVRVNNTNCMMYDMLGIIILLLPVANTMIMTKELILKLKSRLFLTGALKPTLF